ncbi:hypothetical protein DKG74_16945 [Zavarzinia aquatilis]|uniref:DUF1116 domain-containing protein n=1 Tax=Zavarzinia aquatilis TaxID=2211142 RepID=A0A317E2F2_9PROT|nr:hypothetical protein DKG74_16945 [Zavarzinia aquatilis]
MSANEEAVARIAATAPRLTGSILAREALGLRDGELGHAGPPFEPGQTPPPTVLHALCGAAVHEGWARDGKTAAAMIAAGEIRLRANHEIGTVSPMAGVVRPGQRLFRIEDAASGTATFATLAEKGRRVLRFGHYGPDVAAGLAFVEGPVADAIEAALPPGGLEIMPLIARGVELGDDVHQRNIGGMFAFLGALAPLPGEIRDWLATHPQHVLNYAMAAAKLCLDRARGVARSGIVTAITRNGIDCAIQVAGLDGRWFRAPASLPVGGFFPGFALADAHADLGDSAIMEAFGLGGCIAHGAPEIGRAMGRDWGESCAAGRAMRALFLDRQPHIAPALAGAEGVGLGLDAGRVVAAGADIRIHTGISHRDGQSGWIGIGVASAPHAAFAAALSALESADGQP